MELSLSYRELSLILLGNQFSDGRKKANIKFCVPVRKDDDNQNAQFKAAQEVLNKVMLSKEVVLVD